MSTTYVIRLQKEILKHTDRLPTQYNELDEINEQDQVVARVFNRNLTLYGCAGLLPDDTPIIAIDNEGDCKTIGELKKHFFVDRKQGEFYVGDIVEYKHKREYGFEEYKIISIEAGIAKLSNINKQDYIRFKHLNDLRLIYK